MTWRSLLFVPVLEERFLAKAAERGADAVVLDLEDSIAASRKDEARAALAGAVERLSPHIDVTVRINPMWLAAIRDLDACVIPGVSAIHLAQCENAESLRVADALIGELEASRNLEAGKIRLFAMLESAAAMTNVAEIAGCSKRLSGLTLGVEDYANSMGVAATPDLLRPAAYQVVQSARAAGVQSYAIPASMSDFRDLEGLRSAADHARALGTVGGYAVHPGQVGVLNDVFSPTEKEIDWARRVVERALVAEKDGRGVFEVDGRMIDKPLILRAEQMLSRSA